MQTLMKDCIKMNPHHFKILLYHAFYSQYHEEIGNDNSDSIQKLIMLPRIFVYFVRFLLQLGTFFMKVSFSIHI